MSPEQTVSDVSKWTRSPGCGVVVGRAGFELATYGLKVAGIE